MKDAVTASAISSNVPSVAAIAVHVAPPSRVYSAEAIVDPPVAASSTSAVSVSGVPYWTGFGSAVVFVVVGPSPSSNRVGVMVRS